MVAIHVRDVLNDCTHSYERDVTWKSNKYKIHRGGGQTYKTLAIGEFIENAIYRNGFSDSSKTIDRIDNQNFWWVKIDLKGVLVELACHYPEGSINIFKPLSANQRHWLPPSNIDNYPSENISWTLDFEPGISGWEVSMLPLCYAAPHRPKCL